MSQWTHLAGVIRYDGYASGSKADYIKDTLRPLLGNTVSYTDGLAAWDACNVPQGSEGSLQYSIEPGNEDKTDDNITVGDIHLATVTITADLRDYSVEDWPEIKQWWGRVTKNLPKGMSIRQGVLLVETYGHLPEVLIAKDGMSGND